MSVRALAEFFEQRRDEATGLVLATVYDTQGSTYSKAGDCMLIAANGDFQGMLSGGCLEGDLAERAIRVAETGRCDAVTYDLRAESEDELWGLGVGCEGLMRIFLQPLTAANDFEPFRSVLAVQLGDVPGVAATVLHDVGRTEAGSSLLHLGGSWRNFGIDDDLLGEVQPLAAAASNTARSQAVSLSAGAEATEVLCAYLRPTPRVLILGGGLDAEPVLQAVTNLGWRASLQDHRPAYIDKGHFMAAERITCVPAADLSTTFELNRFDAAVVMSHHLDSDRVYLQQLAQSGIRYVGLLGPRDRRRRLLNDLGPEIATALNDRLHGPAGLPLGGRGPAPIALSIVAEMHQVLLQD